MKSSETLKSPSESTSPRSKIGVLLAIAISSCSLAAASEKWNVVGEQRRKIQWVVDGDTFHVCPNADNKCTKEEQLKIRVKGLECPESSQQACDKKPEKDCATRIPQGKKAKAVAIKTLKGQSVTLIPSKSDGHFEADKYKRVLAYVQMQDGSDFGLTMIERGLCYDFGFRYPHERQAQYEAAQKKAGVFPIRKK